MGGEIRPDDLARSPSGRVPKWVLDEANGIEPTERVPFRGATASQVGGQRKLAGRRHRWTTLTIAVLLTGGALVLANQSGLGSSHPPVLPGILANGSDDGAPRTGPPPGAEEADGPLGTPAPLGVESSSYRYSTHQRDEVDKPVTWSPCRPIHYVVRPDNSPPDGSQLLADAFAQLSIATGLRFVADGPTTEGPSEDREAYQKERYGDRWAPVLVTWATPDEVPDFGVDIAGEAGAQRISAPDGRLVYVTGVVTLDPVKLGAWLRSTDASIARLVVLHELGHLVGLAHVNDPGQIMAPRSTKRLSDYQPGDLAGLSSLGQGPCQPDV